MCVLSGRGFLSDDPSADIEDGPVVCHWDGVARLRRVMLRLVLGVEAAAWALVSPVDVERGLVLYSNDDRGMDVGAHDKADLEEIDHWRKPWRLVRSRLQMDALFAADGDAIWRVTSACPARQQPGQGSPTCMVRISHPRSRRRVPFRGQNHAVARARQG